MVAIGNPDLPWAQEAAIQQRWFGCSASVRDTANCALRRPPNQTSRHTIHRQPHVFPAVKVLKTTTNRSQKLVHQVGTRLAQGSAQGWHKVEVGQVANSPFRVVGVVSVVLPSDVEICVVCLRQITQSVILLAKGREIVDFVAVAISRSMILHARASKLIFSFSWRYLKS